MTQSNFYFYKLTFSKKIIHSKKGGYRLKNRSLYHPHTSHDAP